MSIPSSSTYYNEILPSPNSFLSTYIDPTLAISTYRVGAYSFNIKAPNFR